jgi:hypothetical protein
VRHIVSPIKRQRELLMTARHLMLAAAGLAALSIAACKPAPETKADAPTAPAAESAMAPASDSAMAPAAGAMAPSDSAMAPSSGAMAPAPVPAPADKMAPAADSAMAPKH